MLHSFIWVMGAWFLASIATLAGLHLLGVLGRACAREQTKREARQSLERVRRDYGARQRGGLA